MTAPNRPDPPARHWSLAAFRDGVRAMLPAQPGLIAFGLVVGALAAQHGFSATEALLMSAFVYAGMAQLITLQIWPAELTLVAAASLVLVTATVNLRFLLLSAALRPWFGGLPAWQSWPMLAINTDAGFLVAMRYRAAGGNDLGFFLGGALVTWAIWVVATLPGYLLGAFLGAPQRFGLDVVMPAFFVAMLVPMWKGRRRALPWLVAGAVALAVDWLSDGYWFLIAGALAGSVAGGLQREELRHEHG